ncbi:MAG TPA: hypothetical protein VF190_01600 [Rhodothermales bacterium]
MSRSRFPYRIDSASLLATALILRRRDALLRRRAPVVIRDRATPLNLSDPRPFERALRAHMQAVLARRECPSCTG